MWKEVKKSLKELRHPIVAVFLIAMIAAGMLLRAWLLHAIVHQPSVQTETPQEVSIERDAPLTLLYFYSDGCSVCRKMNPIIDKLEEDYAGFASMEHWDVSNPVCHRMANQYRVVGIPTLVLIDSAEQILGRWVGYTPAAKIEQLLDWLQENYKEGE